ncbi:RepB family plasmid replication initiator protein, partial [Kingella kingae]
LDKQTGKGWLDISLEDLRFRFGLLPTEYERMSDFKKRVLDYSINEINDKTDLTATYEQRKKGRVIVGFRFDFTKKQRQQPEKIQETPKTSPEPDLFADFSDVERKAIQSRIDEYIKHQEQKGELISDFYRTNITKKAITERWGLDILVKQQEKAKIAKAERERKKAEEQAEQLKKENERKEIEKQRNFVIKKFELLSSEQQETVIQMIFKEVGQGAFKQIFQNAQKQGTVHTDVRFVKKFYEYFQKEECAKRAKKLTDLPVRDTEKEIKQEDLHPPVQGTISFRDDWKKQVEKQLIMYRDFKNMMNDDTVKEMELVMRMFKITDDDLKKL